MTAIDRRNRSEPFRAASIEFWSTQANSSPLPYPGSRMPRPQIVIESPRRSPPYATSARHVRFEDEGNGDEVVDGPPSSSYFIPTPKAKNGRQLVLDDCVVSSG